ncbi:MAG: diguanylate cyclase [Terracidiphilus sp.]|jgi:diguanylate cyclase (GGDEF)-like protein
MKRLIPAFAIILGWAWTACAAPPAPLASLRAIHALSHAEADKNLPVAFEATITYARGYDLLLFVQDDGVGIYVRTLTDLKLGPGDRVLIKGITQASFRTFVLGRNITFLRHSGLPTPVPASFDQMLRTERDCILVTVHGVVRAIDSNVNSMQPFVSMKMLSGEGAIDLVVNSNDPAQLKDLLDAEVVVTGTASARFEGMRQEGVILNVPSRAGFKVIKHVPLITLPAIHTLHALGNVGAAGSMPLAFEAVVTYYRGYENMLFVQDGAEGIYVRAPNGAGLVPGDRVLVRGKSFGAFRPWVLADSVTLLHHGEPLHAVTTNFNELIHAQRDCILISLRAVVRAADPAWGPSGPTYVQLLTDEGYVDAVLDSDDASARKLILDAEVEVTGVATGKLDGMNQLTGIKLYIPSLKNVRILKRSSASLQSLPVTPMEEILPGYHVHDSSPRVRVRGSITYYQPSSFAVLQDGGRSLRIMTQSNIPLRIGDLADATGFPDVQDGFLTLTRGEIQDTGTQAPIPPLTTDWLDLATSHRIFGLVSIQGRVMTEIREASQDEYVLASDGNLFTAVYRHPDAASHIPLPLMKQIPPGSVVRITGICVLKSANPNYGQVPFDILLRSFDDIAVIANPSWINTRNLILIVGLLLVIMAVVVGWGWTLERKVRRQATAMSIRTEAEATLERRRSGILEDINGSRPLVEILEEITELFSFQLGGAPCWCQITDSALVGNCPPQPSACRIARIEIPARSGLPLGTIFAAFEADTKPADLESEALTKAAGLATLAIETRRLYTDLRRRSEFDLLTDSHNRFSLDQYLDTLVDEARLSVSIFGLIYIDLDKFKQVNDQYGHHIGDLYLQEVARRMKRQLRSHDMLARLGGDEFAALVSVVSSAAEVQEVGVRLDRCFDEPFSLEGNLIHGSASIGIAIYPQNGATRDSLLNAADAAMYVAKNIKRRSIAGSSMMQS